MCEASAAEQASVARPAASAAAPPCPTCRTAWRGVAICPRCGTELTVLMQVAMQAWVLRQAARRALCDTDGTAAALTLAQEACRLQNTPEAQRLLALALLAQGQQTAATTVLAGLLSLD